MEIIKQAMDKAIPKSSNKFIHQLKITPEIRNLENQFRSLQQNATINEWSNEYYREYTRIRYELREGCRKIYNKN